MQVRIAVDKVILAESADRKQQLAAWVAEKKKISAYAMDLQQLENGVCASYWMEVRQMQ